MKLHKLDAVFSEYIRLSHADEYGIVKCVTCGKYDHWKRMDCGHFIPRTHLATRFNEVNCAPQCPECNQWKGGMLEKYYKQQIKLI